MQFIQLIQVLGDTPTRKLHFLVYFTGPNLSSVCVQWSSDVFAAADPWGRGGERELSPLLTPSSYTAKDQWSDKRPFVPNINHCRLRPGVSVKNLKLQESKIMRCVTASDCNF